MLMFDGRQCVPTCGEQILHPFEVMSFPRYQWMDYQTFIHYSLVKTLSGLVYRAHVL